MERRKDKYLSDSDIVRIVETYSDMLLRIALNRVRSIPAAEDIVQGVFERLMRRRPIFESREHEKAWLIRTAVNLCLSDLRTQSRHGDLPLDENIAGEFGDDSYEVLDAVQNLPVQDRYAVYLYYYEGYGVKEIGKLLKEPDRKKLKTILEGGNHGRQIQQRL